MGVGLSGSIDGDRYLLEFGKLLARLNLSKYDIIFHNAGTDVPASDALGGFQLTKEDVVNRDMLIAEYAFQNKIPLVIVLSGGYSKESWQAHYLSLREIINFYSL